MSPEFSNSNSLTGNDYVSIGTSVVDLTMDYFGLAKVTTPAGAVLTGTSMLLNKVSLLSLAAPNSITKNVFDTIGNAASVGLAIAAESTAGVALGSLALGYGAGTLMNDKLIGGYWGNKAYDFWHRR